MLSNIVIVSGLVPYSDLSCTERNCISQKFVIIGHETEMLTYHHEQLLVCFIVEWPLVFSSPECGPPCATVPFPHSRVIRVHVLVYALHIHVQMFLCTVDAYGSFS